MRRFISHVQIPVKNLEKAVEWYEKYLGCERLANFGQFVVIRFKDDNVNIFLWKTTDESKAIFTVNGEPYPTIGFEVEDMDSLMDSLQNFDASQDAEGRRFLKFSDFDGNLLIAHTK